MEIIPELLCILKTLPEMWLFLTDDFLKKFAGQLTITPWLGVIIIFIIICDEKLNRLRSAWEAN